MSRIQPITQMPTKNISYSLYAKYMPSFNDTAPSKNHASLLDLPRLLWIFKILFIYSFINTLYFPFSSKDIICFLSYLILCGCLESTATLYLHKL